MNTILMVSLLCHDCMKVVEYGENLKLLEVLNIVSYLTK